VKDGFVPGQTLFDIEEALQKGTIICYLLSDAAQIQYGQRLKKHLTKGKALYFSTALVSLTMSAQASFHQLM
jgi:ketol-acid reductoisomerase